MILEKFRDSYYKRFKGQFLEMLAFYEGVTPEDTPGLAFSDFIELKDLSEICDVLELASGVSYACYFCDETEMYLVAIWPQRDSTAPADEHI